MWIISSGIFRGKLQQIKTDRHTLCVTDPLTRNLTDKNLTTMKFAALSIFVGVSISVFVVMPVVSTPNFNLATRQKFKGHEMHKHVSSSRPFTRVHKRRHAISRRDTDVISTVTDDQSQQICTSDKQREIWQSIVYCQPNPTLVELQKPPSAAASTNNNIVHMMPGNKSQKICTPISRVVYWETFWLGLFSNYSFMI